MYLNLCEQINTALDRKQLSVRVWQNELGDFVLGGSIGSFYLLQRAQALVVSMLPEGSRVDPSRVSVK